MMVHDLTRRWDVLIGFAFLLIWVGLYVARRAPSAADFRDFVETLAGRGGNILLLLVLTGWFFAVAVRLFYFSLSLIAQGKLDEKSAVLMMALQFITGTAFGGAFGALLKTLDGQVHGAAPMQSPPVPTPAQPPSPSAAALAGQEPASAPAVPPGWEKNNPRP